jgi:hypothetical protein
MSAAGRTENGAVSFATTGSPLLDFYFHAPVLTLDDLDRAAVLFEAAFYTDPLPAIKALFYIRDPRGGQGRREAFRICLEWLANHHPDYFRSLMPLIPEFGRWDDLIIFAAHPKVGLDVTKLITDQLIVDLRADHPSLLAKWMPSENAHSLWARRTAHLLRDRLFPERAINPRTQRNMRAKKYRRALSILRRQIGIVESLMSSGQWDKINFSNVPSQAMRIYRRAFSKHQNQRFVEWLAGARAGKNKIQVGTLTPFEIVRELYNGRYDVTLQTMWDAFEDFLGDQDVLCVCDTSGSMLQGDSTPFMMAVAITLYTATRNKGQFRGKFISFNERPQLIDIPIGAPLMAQYQMLRAARIGYNTNLQAVFNQILAHAVQFRVPQEGMPKRVLIASDMQFDQAAGQARPPHVGPDGWTRLPATNFDAIREQYAAAGYTMPELIFWNVRSADMDTPVQQNERGVYLVSGNNPVIFKKALLADTSANPTPYQSMLQVLNSDRYSVIDAAVIDAALSEIHV